MENNIKTKKTSVEEALLDFEILLKEADKSAREKIIKSMPDKFDKILNEEIKKITNKKSDKEPIIEGEKKELVNNKKSEKINEEVDLTNESMGAVEDVYNNAELEDEFTVEADEYDFDEIENELLQMDRGEMPPEMGQELDFDAEQGAIPDMSNEAQVVTDPYAQFKSLYEQMGKIVNDMEEKEMQKEYMTEFEGHLTEMFGDEHNLDEAAIGSLYEKFEAHKKGAPYGEGKLNENESEPFDNPEKSNGESDPFDETDKKNIKEMKQVGGKSGPDQNAGNPDNAGGPTQSRIEEGVIAEAIDPDALNVLAGTLGVLASAGGLAGLMELVKRKFPNAAAQIEKVASSASSGIQGGNQPNMGESVVAEGVIAEAMDPNAINVLAGTLGVLASAGGIAGLMELVKRKFPNVAAQIEKLASSASSGIQGGNQPNMGESVEIEVTDDEEEDKEAIDEIHGQSYSAGKVNAGRLPNEGAEYRDRAGHSRNRPEWSNESVAKKMKTLFEDKKKLSKKLNEYRNSLTKSNKIVEQYKNGFAKYKTHLQEMAIFNTNLSHVNNILVESVENKEDVKGIINKFKNIENIDESKKVYNEVITEMKKNDKDVITEQVEAKLNKEVIGESSSVNGDRSKVITESAYKNDVHLNKLKGLINYKLAR